MELLIEKVWFDDGTIWRRGTTHMTEYALPAPPDAKRLAILRELAGVTVTTVSRMLNGRTAVSERTRRKIRQAMEALDYYPNEMARSLKSAAGSFIGLIVPSVQYFFFAAVVEYVERIAFQRGYKLLLCVTNKCKGKVD